jgi:hypothetical protein
LNDAGFIVVGEVHKVGRVPRHDLRADDIADVRADLQIYHNTRVGFKHTDDLVPESSAEAAFKDCQIKLLSIGGGFAGRCRCRGRSRCRSRGRRCRAAATADKSGQA